MMSFCNNKIVLGSYECHIWNETARVQVAALTLTSCVILGYFSFYSSLVKLRNVCVHRTQSLQSCLTLRYPMDCSLPGDSPDKNI